MNTIPLYWKLFNLSVYQSERNGKDATYLLVLKLWPFFKHVQSWSVITKTSPRATTRVVGLYVSIQIAWSRDLWRQPYNLRLKIIDVLLWTCLILCKFITDVNFITLVFKCYYRRLGPNVITDGTFITLVSKCYYRWDLYYAWVHLLHLCPLQGQKLRGNKSRVNNVLTAKSSFEIFASYYFVMGNSKAENVWVVSARNATWATFSTG